MKFPIGSMTIGDILDRGLKLLLARLSTFYAINLAVMLPVFLLQLLVPMLSSNSQSAAVSSAIIVAVLIFVLQYFILQPIGAAASLYVIAQEFVDRGVSLGEAFSFAVSRFPSLLGATLLVGLLLVAIILVSILPGMVLAIGGAGGAGIALLFLGMLVGGIVSVVIYLRYAFVAQIVVVENKGAMESLPRSSSLTEGHRGRIFAALILLIIVGFVLGLLAAGISFIFPYQEVVQTGVGMPVQVFKSYPNYVINMIAAYLINALAASYGAVCLTLLYFDLRIRKEGFDLEMAAQQQMAVR